ncbi:hypothetical protein Tco_0490052 [Tanacetum coccineum]
MSAKPTSMCAFFALSWLDHENQTKSVSEGLETVLTQPTTEKGASSTTIHGDKEEASSTIKLEDLAKLVSQIQPSFKDLDSPEDDPVIIVDESDKDEPNAETEDTLVPRSSSPRSSQIQELTNQVLILQSQKHKLELEKNKSEAEATLLKAQPLFPNMKQLNELLVKSLQNEFSKILSSHDFSSSLPTELKDLPSKFNELIKEIKGLKTQVHELEIELPKELKEIPTKLEDFTKTTTSLTSQVAELKTLQRELPKEFLSLPAKVESAQAKLKTLDALPSLLLNVTKALNKFSKVLESTSTKARDQSVPSAGQADTMPAEGEKDTNQATISQLFQRRAEKIAEAEKENMNQQPKPTTPPTTTPINPSIITTTTQMQTPLQSSPKSYSQPEGEHIKKDKGKKIMSSEEAKKESTESDFDEEPHVTGSMVKSSKENKLKKFDFVTECREHVHLTKEQISTQKEIEEEAKAEAARREGEIRNEELIDLLGLEIVDKYYNDKLQYDKYCDKMRNRKAASRITNCDVLTRTITLKVYREDGTSEIIPNFKASDLHLGEWRMEACPKRTGKGWEIIYKQIRTRIDYIHTTEAELGINLDIPLSKQDPLDKLNDLTNKKRKHVDDIHDYFKATKRLKSSVQYGDHEPILGMIMFNSYHREDFVTIEDLKDF